MCPAAEGLMADRGSAALQQSRTRGSYTTKSMLLFIYSSMVLTKAAWALVSVTVSEVPAIMIAGTMAIVAVL